MIFMEGVVVESSPPKYFGNIRLFLLKIYAVFDYTGILYHFDRKFTNSENLLAEMADKFSFEF